MKNANGAPDAPGVDAALASSQRFGTEMERALRLEIRCYQALALHDAVRLLLVASLPGVETSVVMDEQMHRDGIVVQLAGSTRWMFVATNPLDPQTTRAALADGAWCLAVLDGSVDQFTAAAESLVHGTSTKVPISVARDIAGSNGVVHAASEVPQAGPSRRVLLTRRERDVLACLAEGLSNVEIAGRLQISIHTVRTHLASMATKLDTGSRIKLVARAAALGYVPGFGAPMRAASVQP